MPLWPEVAWWSGSRAWMIPAALLSPGVGGLQCLNSCLSKSILKNKTKHRQLQCHCFQTNVEHTVCDISSLTWGEPLLLAIVPRIRGGGADEPVKPEGWKTTSRDIKQQTILHSAEQHDTHCLKGDKWRISLSINLPTLAVLVNKMPFCCNKSSGNPYLQHLSIIRIIQ